MSTTPENLFNKHYTLEQDQYLDQPKQLLGNEVIQQVKNDWQNLFGLLQEQMNKGTDATDEKVLILAQRAC
ncbi:MAG: hypothetical protein ICV85_15565 [Tolypothrix sp. T3-bin4]|nr:hypothetical protein [Tolypothrix sp. Co-bin9]MBD0303526.1 hypothetical protein [Tolypothrix sp. T3-bin4]